MSRVYYKSKQLVLIPLRIVSFWIALLQKRWWRRLVRQPGPTKHLLTDTQWGADSSSLWGLEWPWEGSGHRRSAFSVCRYPVATSWSLILSSARTTKVRLRVQYEFSGLYLQWASIRKDEARVDCRCEFFCAVVVFVDFHWFPCGQSQTSCLPRIDPCGQGMCTKVN